MALWPLAFIVADVLPESVENIELSYTVGNIAEGSKFGESLFLHYTDTVTRGELLDIMLPSLSDETLKALESKPIIKVLDQVRNVTITLEPEPCLAGTA